MKLTAIPALAQVHAALQHPLLAELHKAAQLQPHEVLLLGCDYYRRQRPTESTHDYFQELSDYIRGKDTGAPQADNEDTYIFHFAEVIDTQVVAARAKALEHNPTDFGEENEEIVRRLETPHFLQTLLELTPSLLQLSKAQTLRDHPLFAGSALHPDAVLLGA